MSPVALASPHTSHLPFPTFLSVFTFTPPGMSLAYPRMPMRKRERCSNNFPVAPEPRTPVSKRIRSQAYPQSTVQGDITAPTPQFSFTPRRSGTRAPASTIPLRRHSMVFLQPGGRPVAVSRPRAAAGRSLRRAAILNLARKKGWTVPSPELLEVQPENVNLEDIRGEADDLVARRIQASTRTPRRSPLGLSNYEELDQWHGYHHDDFDEGDPGGVYDQDEEEGAELYSDFNFLDTASTSSKDDDEDDDYDDPFTVLPSTLPRRKSAEDSTSSDRPQNTNQACNPNFCVAAHGAGRVCC